MDVDGEVSNSQDWGLRCSYRSEIRLTVLKVCLTSFGVLENSLTRLSYTFDICSRSYAILKQPPRAAMMVTSSWHFKWMFKDYLRFLLQKLTVDILLSPPSKLWDTTPAHWVFVLSTYNDIFLHNVLQNVPVVNTTAFVWIHINVFVWIQRCLYCFHFEWSAYHTLRTDVWCNYIKIAIRWQSRGVTMPFITIY